ncbi:MAG: hypothetical protein ACR2J1_04910 [Methyloceanibacter sp.]|uniref:hypothetical protein n=1 Tax=Methyloceanibacter sp. TaxID=1965321 RepID=UPI003D9BBECF
MQASQMTRRKAMTLVAAAPAAAVLPPIAAATVIPATGVPAEKGSSELNQLIKAHRTAYRAFCRAIDREQKMEEDYKKVRDNTILVPCFLTGDAFELQLGYEFCGERLEASYTRQRKQLENLTRVFPPDLVEQSLAVIDAKQKENFDVLDRMFAEEDARREAFGLAPAKRDWEATNDAEQEAALAICAYNCRSFEEAAVKARYLATAPGLRDGLLDEHVDALLQSFFVET